VRGENLRRRLANHRTCKRDFRETETLLGGNSMVWGKKRGGAREERHVALPWKLGGGERPMLTIGKDGDKSTSFHYLPKTLGRGIEGKNEGIRTRKESVDLQQSERPVPVMRKRNPSKQKKRQNNPRRKKKKKHVI